MQSLLLPLILSLSLTLLPASFLRADWLAPRCGERAASDRDLLSLGSVRLLPAQGGWRDEPPFEPAVFIQELTTIVNHARYRYGLPLLLKDEALSRASNEILRTALARAGGGSPDLLPVELAIPLTRFGVRGRLVKGIQVHFRASAFDLAQGFFDDEADSEQLLYRDYGFIGGAAADVGEGRRYLVLALSTGIVDLDKFRRDIYLLVNQVRESRGFPAVSWDNGAARAAQIRATEIAACFSHQRPSGEHWSTVLGELGLSAAEAGENLANGHRNPMEVMIGLMESPGHRANILSESFNQLGVGCQIGDDGQLGCVQIFLRR